MSSKLELRWKERPGGGGKTSRRFLDIIVDGRPLLEAIGCPPADFISRLGWGSPEAHSKSVEHLLMKVPPDSPSKRVLLLICPECGDLGCGAFTAKITKNADDYVWSDFAFENDYEGAPTELFPEAGPFSFTKQEYWATLTASYEKTG